MVQKNVVLVFVCGSFFRCCFRCPCCCCGSCCSYSVGVLAVFVVRAVLGSVVVPVVLHVFC